MQLHGRCPVRALRALRARLEARRAARRAARARAFAEAVLARHSVRYITRSDYRHGLTPDTWTS